MKKVDKSSFAGTEAEKRTEADNQHVSQPNGNTNVVGSLLGQREIKFRAWDGEKMIYPVNGWVEKVSLPDHFSYQSMQLGTAIRYLKVMQYTGLKDTHGQDIYEGDFLMVWDEDGIEYDFLPQVVWGGDYPAFDLCPSLGCEYNELQHATLVGSCEVVGNIFETPELLQSVE